MTPIATKNNAIIIKDGKLAENCGCCEGWYCCPDWDCYTVSSPTITISNATDYAWSASGQSFQENVYSPGAYLNGTHSFSSPTDSDEGGIAVKQWTKMISGGGGACQPGTALVLRTRRDGWRLYAATMSYTSVDSCAALFPNQSPQSKSLSDIGCAESSSCYSGNSIDGYLTGSGSNPDGWGASGGGAIGGAFDSCYTQARAISQTMSVSRFIASDPGQYISGTGLYQSSSGGEYWYRKTVRYQYGSNWATHSESGNLNATVTFSATVIPYAV
jgi:hypothetical protein